MKWCFEEEPLNKDSFEIELVAGIIALVELAGWVGVGIEVSLLELVGSPDYLKDYCIEDSVVDSLVEEPHIEVDLH